MPGQAMTPIKMPHFHAEMAEIMGDNASTHPKMLMGSGLPVSLESQLIELLDEESPETLITESSGKSSPLEAARSRPAPLLIRPRKSLGHEQSTSLPSASASDSRLPPNRPKLAAHLWRH